VSSVADKKRVTPAGEKALAALAAANIPHTVAGNKVAIEFRIQDLVNRFAGGLVASHCSGCIGCTGCKN
jgi:hypothetical protein